MLVFLPNTKPIRVLVSCILLGSYLHIYGCAMALPKHEKIPAILVFGDSIVDSGNNNYLNTIAKANFPPYGRDLDGGVPTGRYSNGKVPSDLLGDYYLLMITKFSLFCSVFVLGLMRFGLWYLLQLSSLVLKSWCLLISTHPSKSVTCSLASPSPLGRVVLILSPPN